MAYLDGVKVIVFDFDGTLVQTREIKYNAYFKLFPNDKHHIKVITEVLSEMYEESRYAILEMILKKLKCEENMTAMVNQLAEKYNELVLSGAKESPECEDAEKILTVLERRLSVYLSSTTPEDSLEEIVVFRGWREYFREIFGYPKNKYETLQNVIMKEGIEPQQLLVVGDGESDYQSALKAGTRFFRINNDSRLADILK